MTRLPRNGTGGPARKLAAAHAQGGFYRLLVAEIRGGSVSIIEARSLREADLAPAVAAIIRDHKPDQFVRIAPGSGTVCRSVELPGGEAAAGALPLMAEAELPETLPPHRRAAGLMPGESPSGGRVALLTGWRDQDTAPPRPLTDTPETWVAEIAALALLRGDSGVAVYAERGDGAISLIAGGTRTIARILVEDGQSAAGWTASLRTAVRETCQAAGVDRVPVPEGGEITLELPDDAVTALRARVRGMKDDGRWLAEFGLALGAILVASDHNPLTASLATMTADGQARRDPPWERAALWLSTPRNAWAVVAASLVLLIAGPLAVAGGRLAILSAKSGELEAGRKERQRIESQSALYAQLEQLRWPMTKLLADIAGATPVGIVVDDLRLGTDLGVTVHGTAQNLDQLYTFQRNLATSRVFKDVKINRSEVSGSAVEFDMAADVGSPHIAAKPAEDFGAVPLAVRLYGEGASNTATPVAHRTAASTGTAPRPAARPSRNEEPRENGASGSSSARRESSGETPSRRPQPAAPDTPPPALTAEQIAAMDRTTAMKEWVSRKTYPQRNPEVDVATKQRLEEEVVKLKERMDQAKGDPS